MKFTPRAFFVSLTVLIAFLFFVATATAAPTICQIGNGCTGTSTAPGYGKLLIGGPSGEYEYVASSTFGGGGGGAVSSVFGRTGAVSAQSGDYTTSLIPEGSNLYWTQTRFDNALSASSSVKSITTLPSLSLPYGQLTGTPDLTAYLTLTSWYATTTDGLREGTNNLYFTNARADARVVSGIAATSSIKSVTTLPSLSLPYSQLTGTPDLTQYLTLSAWYATTTDQLREGTNNLYFTNARADARVVAGIAGTSSVSSIFTLPNLSLPYGQVSGAPTVPSLPVSIANGGTAVSTQTANGINFFDGSKITSVSTLTFTGGNTGIGTSSPQRKLHVADTGNTKDQVLIEDTTGAANQHYQGIQSANGKLNIDQVNDSLATSTEATLSTSNTPAVLVGTSTQLSNSTVATFTAGPGATSTVNVGNIGDTSSKSCINMQNAAGTAVSLYVAGTSLIIQTGTCQ